MALIRSVLHMLFMVLTVIPYATVIVLGAALGMGRPRRYRIAAAWLGLCSLPAARVRPVPLSPAASGERPATESLAG